jgi:hypothetical protein
MTAAIRNAVDADLGALIRLNARVQRLHAQVYPADGIGRELMRRALGLAPRGKLFLECNQR